MNLARGFSSINELLRKSAVLSLFDRQSIKLGKLSVLFAAEACNETIASLDRAHIFQTLFSR